MHISLPHFFMCFCCIILLNHLGCKRHSRSSTHLKYVDELRGVTDSFEDTDFHKLQGQKITNHMKFNRSKHQILYLRQGNPGYMHRWGRKGWWVAHQDPEGPG